jgi:hypothetical protein
VFFPRPNYEFEVYVWKGGTFMFIIDYGLNPALPCPKALLVEVD